MRQIADNHAYKIPGTIEDANVVVDITHAIESIGYGQQRSD